MRRVRPEVLIAFSRGGFYGIAFAFLLAVLVLTVLLLLSANPAHAQEKDPDPWGEWLSKEEIADLVAARKTLPTVQKELEETKAALAAERATVKTQAKIIALDDVIIDRLKLAAKLADDIAGLERRGREMAEAKNAHLICEGRVTGWAGAGAALGAAAGTPTGVGIPVGAGAGAILGGGAALIKCGVDEVGRFVRRLLE